MSHRVLNQEQFHGTRYPFEIGHEIDPSQHPEPGKVGHAFFTPHLYAAQQFAEGAGGPRDDFDAPPRVYKVQPLGHVERDPDEHVDRESLEDPSYRAYRTPHKLRVMERVL